MSTCMIVNKIIVTISTWMLKKETVYAVALYKNDLITSYFKLHAFVFTKGSQL